MPKTIIFIKTWRCDKCNSSVDFEPTETNYIQQQYGGTGDGECPNKKSRGCNGLMIKVSDPFMKSKLTIMGEEELETLEIETDELDVDGKNKKRKLTPVEKEEKRLKIRADIEKFRALEDK